MLRNEDRRKALDAVFEEQDQHLYEYGSSHPEAIAQKYIVQTKAATLRALTIANVHASQSV